MLWSEHARRADSDREPLRIDVFAGAWVVGRPTEILPRSTARRAWVDLRGVLDGCRIEIDGRQIVRTTDGIEEFVRATFAPASWDERPEFSLRISREGVLEIAQSPWVVEQVVLWLDELR